MGIYPIFRQTHMFVMSVLFSVLAELHPRFPRLAILRKHQQTKKSDGSMRYIWHWAHIENIEISSTLPAYGHATTRNTLSSDCSSCLRFTGISPRLFPALSSPWFWPCHDPSPHEIISCFAISLFLFRHVLMCIWCVLDLSAQVFSQWHFAWGSGHWGRVEEPPSYEVSIAVDVA